MPTSKEPQSSRMSPFEGGPIVVRDNLYMHPDGTMVACFSLATCPVPDAEGTRNPIARLLEKMPVGMRARVVRVSGNDVGFLLDQPVPWDQGSVALKLAQERRNQVLELSPKADRVYVALLYQARVRTAHRGAGTPMTPIPVGALASSDAYRLMNAALGEMEESIKPLVQEMRLSGLGARRLGNEELISVARWHLGLSSPGEKDAETQGVGIPEWETGRGWVRARGRLSATLTIRGAHAANPDNLLSLTAVFAMTLFPVTFATEAAAVGAPGSSGRVMAVRSVLVVSGDTTEELNEACAECIALGRAGAGIVLSRTMDGAHVARQMYSVYPFAPREEDESDMTRLSAEAAAALSPVFSAFTPDDAPVSVHMGMAGRLLPFDISSRRSRNRHMVVVGRSGIGKSMFVKTELLMARAATTNTQTIVLDSYGEYVRTAEALGGQVFRIGRDVRLDPFGDGAWRPSVNQEEQGRYHHGDILTFLAAFNGDVEHVSTDALFRILDRFYVHTQGLPSTLEGLKQIVEHYRINDASDDVVRACEYLSVALERAMLALGATQDTSLPALTSDMLTAKVVVLAFDTPRATDHAASVASALLGLVEHLTHRRDGVERTLVLDEFWGRISKMEVCARIVTRMYREGRSYGLGVVTVGQMLSDYTESPLGREILQNSSTHVFLPTAQTEQQDKAMEAIDLSSATRGLVYALRWARGERLPFVVRRDGVPVLHEAMLGGTSYWLATLDPDDTALFRQYETILAHQNLSDLEVCAALGHDYPHGAANKPTERKLGVAEIGPFLESWKKPLTLESGRLER